MKTTTKAYRVTFLVDVDTFQFLSRSHLMSEDGELWDWESTVDVDFEMETCDDCGSRSMMMDYKCPYQQEFCLDCCGCEGLHE